jgi:hypothetical protein
MGSVQVSRCYQVCPLGKTFWKRHQFLWWYQGECNHKKFVKETGRNTQKRIRTFTSQVGKRYYEEMALEIPQKAIDLQGIGNEMNLELAHHQENYEQNSFGLGTYKLTFVGLDHQGQFNDHHICAKKN